jgi:hypothetical protein
MMGFAVLYPSYSGYSGYSGYPSYADFSINAVVPVVGWVEAIAETHHIHPPSIDGFRCALSILRGLRGLEDDDLASGLIGSSPIRVPLRSLGELGKVVMPFYTPALRYNYQG